MTAIATRIVKIGNSQGIRIPVPLLEQSGLVDEVTLEVQAGAIVIRAAKKPRDGWDAQFIQMAANGDDQLGEWDVVGNKWDEDEWEW